MKRKTSTPNNKWPNTTATATATATPTYIEGYELSRELVNRQRLQIGFDKTKFC